MTNQTKIHAQIFITHVQLLATHVLFGVDPIALAELNKAANKLKESLEGETEDQEQPEESRV